MKIVRQYIKLRFKVFYRRIVRYYSELRAAGCLVAKCKDIY